MCFSTRILFASYSVVNSPSFFLRSSTVMRLINCVFIRPIGLQDCSFFIKVFIGKNRRKALYNPEEKRDMMRDYRFIPVEEQEPIEFDETDDFLLEETEEAEERTTKSALFIAS